MRLRLLPTLLAALLVSAAACTTSDPEPAGQALDAGADDPTTIASSTSTTTTTSTSTTTTTAPTAAVDACPTVPARRAPDPNRPDYDVQLHADPTTGQVSGTQTVRFRPDLDITTMVLRLWANGPRPSSVGSSIELGRVSEDGVPRVVEQPEPTTAVVHLGRVVRAGEEVTLTVPWQLQVNGPINDRISRQAESLRLGSFVPLLAWEPGVGWAVEPPTSGFAESTTSPTADWRVRITVPDGFGVVASGVRSSDDTWVATLARDIAVSVGRFTIAQGQARAPHDVDVVVAVHAGIDDPDAYLGQVVSQLETFAALYGPYPWPVYQLSITPELSGGIEYPMHVMQGPSTDGRTTPHEVAHMWFYGLVGNNQGRHPWMDEGLATYAEGRVLGTLGSMRSQRIPAGGAGRAGEPMTYWETRPSSYYRSVYVQPAAALSRLGPVELVDCALAFYVADNAYTIAGPDDFFEALDATFTNWRPTLAAAGL